MTGSFKSTGYFKYGSDWNYDFSATSKFYFKITTIADKVEYLLIIRSDELVASDNQFIKIDGVAFVFNSSEEIQDLIDKISTEKVRAFINKNKTAQDLFKD